MKFNVTDVEFDYCNELVTHDDEIAANDVALGIWTTQNRSTLIEDIQTCAGYRIINLEYDIINKQCANKIGGTLGVALVTPSLIIKTSTTQDTNMRKIESQMNSAIRSRSSFSSANTSVVIDDNNAAYVYLHGNHIATIDNDNVTLFDGGWQSNTTKSRLNAILQEFAYGVGVFQKQWEWFVCNQNKTVDFTNGMQIAL